MTEPQLPGQGDNPPRAFTVEEANALVPFLEETFTRIFQVWILAQGLYEKLKDRLDEENPRSAEELKDPEFARDYGKLRVLIETLRSELKTLEDLGVIVRSVENGIVDFYSVREGKPVFLCWSYGEKEISYWHEVEAGFAGRRSLQELGDF